MATRPADMRAKDAWDEKLRRRGHTLRWRRIARWPHARWRGVCPDCAGDIECGSGRAAGYLSRYRGRC
jgi:hypothetical protein